MPLLVLITAGIVVMLSTHESSKLAFVGAVVAFAGAWLAPRLTGRLVATGWILACLAVLPLALLAHHYNLHNATWLQGTARHRIIIWNYTAEQVLKAPWLGVGARTTYVLGPRTESQIPTAPDEAFKRTLSTHSHSVYLQTWFELGLIGATLLTLLGLSILQAIRELSLDLQPYAYATFAAAALMAASSYGMWQIWFASLFGLCAALFGLGAALARTRSAAS
jgi:O-antigen ligase